MGKNNVVVHIVANADTEQAVEKVIADLQRVREAAEKSNQALSAGASRMVSALGGPGAMLAGGLGFATAIYGARMLVGALSGVVRETTDVAMQLKRMGEQTGISTEDLSVLRYASLRTGVSFETLSRGFKHLATVIYEEQRGMKSASLGFDALGITQKEVAATGYDVWKVLELVQKKFAELPNGVQKSAAATALFGRSSQNMIPILNDGAEGLDALKGAAEAAGAVWTDLDLQKMEEMKQKTTDLAMAWERLKRSMSESAPVEMGTEWLTSLLTGISHIPEDIERGGGLNLGVVPLGRLGTVDSAAPVSSPKKPAPPIVDPTAQQAAIREAQQANRQALAQRRALEQSEMSTVRAGIASESRSRIAALEALHKQQLLSDRAYYTQREAAQEEAWRRERAVVEEQRSTAVEDRRMLEKQHPADAAGKLQVQAQVAAARERELAATRELTQLDGQRMRDNIALAEAAAEAAHAAQLRRAQVGSDLERAQGGTHAQAAIRAQQLAAADERRKLGAQGATQAELAQFDALEKIREAKLRIAALDAQQRETMRGFREQEDAVNQAQLSGTMTQEAAAQQLQAIQQREIVALHALQQAYQALGPAAADAAAQTNSAVTGIMRQMHEEMKSATQDVSTATGEAEKMAHSIFDPLTHGAQRWRDTWRQIVNGLASDMEKLVESQLFGMLFGDPQGRGGRGLNGTSFKGDTSNPWGAGATGAAGMLGGLLSHFHHTGNAPATPPASAPTGMVAPVTPGQKSNPLAMLEGLALRGAGALGGLFHKHANVVSNGGLGAGAGALPTAAAAAANIGNPQGGESGVQVVIHNHGNPVAAASASKMTSQMSQQVVNIVLKDISHNGSIGQSITAIATSLIAG